MSPRMLIQCRLGLQVQELNNALRRALGLPEQLAGLVISDISPQSDLAGRRLRYGDAIRRGDVVVSAEGHEVARIEDLRDVLQETQGGDTITLIIVAVDSIGGRVALSPMRVNVTLN
jgi:S1-C subfamily serine protease